MKQEQIKSRLIEMMNKVNKITLNEEILQGGLGDNKPTSGFSIDQIQKGLEVEKEHTDDVDVALEIVKDHLSENPNYYGDNGSNPDSCAQCNAEKDTEDGKEKNNDEEITDVLLGFKPHNVGDYVSDNNEN